MARGHRHRLAVLPVGQAIGSPPREDRTFFPLRQKPRDAVGSFCKGFNITPQNCGRFHNIRAAFVKNDLRATPGTSSWHIGCAGSLEDVGRCNDCQIPGVTHQFHCLQG